MPRTKMMMPRVSGMLSIGKKRVVRRPTFPSFDGPDGAPDLDAMTRDEMKKYTEALRKRAKALHLFWWSVSEMDGVLDTVLDTLDDIREDVAEFVGIDSVGEDGQILLDTMTVPVLVERNSEVDDFAIHIDNLLDGEVVVVDPIGDGDDDDDQDGDCVLVKEVTGEEKTSAARLSAVLVE
jgi:hypothetical protein